MLNELAKEIFGIFTYKYDESYGYYLNVPKRSFTNGQGSSICIFKIDKYYFRFGNVKPDELVKNFKSLKCCNFNLVSIDFTHPDSINECKKLVELWYKLANYYSWNSAQMIGYDHIWDLSHAKY